MMFAGIFLNYKHPNGNFLLLPLFNFYLFALCCFVAFDYPYNLNINTFSNEPVANVFKNAPGCFFSLLSVSFA